MFPTPHLTKPAGEKASIRKPRASPHLVRIGEGLTQLVTMLREQVGMAFPNVPFTFGGQFNIPAQVKDTQGASLILLVRR